MNDSDYIKWVQRSLNYDGAGLEVNGVDNKTYRDAVAVYKTRYSVKDGLALTQVGSACQDVMIRNNRLSPDFQKWLQSVLPDATVGNPDATVAAVKSFQKSANLKADGHVGPKTEKALIDKFKKKPEDKPVVKPLPENDPVVKWFNGLSPNQRYTYIAEQCYVHYQLKPADAELKALAKFLCTSPTEPIPRYFHFFTRTLADKLRFSSDPRLIKHLEKGWYQWYIRFNDEVCKVLMHSYMDRTDAWVRLSPYFNVSRRDQLDEYINNFIHNVHDLHRTIVDGIGVIAYWCGYVGEQAPLKLGKNTIVGLAKDQRHVYSVYAGRMPNEWGDDLTFPHSLPEHTN